ncbi:MULTISPECIES: TIGR01440 family protein [unclassified Peribacillus]|uniref:TIGR01440 family protein n=1 Tax=unclassified Peribacillus TaxID=2675266 RepID=UPI001913E2B2|nr:MULTISPECIES: TIGR01440 family protein [unclassified Peribacillus]MBK5461218.1 TIGR01440 family protein [Peribacillus sp. TH27]MBK5499360.1 TIGR01440 family protein [Peribacillus sp. TH14]
MTNDTTFSDELEIWKNQFRILLHEFQEEAALKEKQLLVIGCSTSEVIGKRIGTDGTIDVAGMIFAVMEDFQRKTGIQVAYQCCEHLNRALVLPRETAVRRDYEEVSVVPVRTAGGSMATYAYQQWKDAIVVEHIKAEAGIDIGDTFIGMHLKHVAVPVRVSIKEIGHAHVTMAKTRPKLIGGERAVYQDTTVNKSCT